MASGPSGPIVDIGDTVRTDGSRGQIAVTVDCVAGSVFQVELELTQGSAAAQGSARGRCTGSAQEVRIGFATAGPAVGDGPADACVEGLVGVPGTEAVTDSGERCEEVTVSLG